MSTESVILSNHFILCRPLLLPPSIFHSIRVFSNKSALHIRWPKYWSFSYSISPSKSFQDWFPLGWTGWISLQSKGLSRVFSNTTVQKHQFFGIQLYLWSNSIIHSKKKANWRMKCSEKMMLESNTMTSRTVEGAAVNWERGLSVILKVNTKKPTQTR